jgi:polyhydroxyalkanoate synthesis regulator phasin
MEGTIRNQEQRTVTQERAVARVSPGLSGFLNRISFSAIIAGVAVALVFQIALNLLGISMGANSIDPLTEQNPIDARIAIPAVLWIVASALISLFAGGYVAAHMAGAVEREDGVLHGISAWAFATLISLVFMTSTIGNIVGTAANVLGRGLSLAGSAVADLSPEVTDALNLQDIRLDAITGQAQEILSAAQPAVQPPATTTDGTTDTATATGETTDERLTPQQRELNLNITRLLMSPADDPDMAANRETVVNALVEQGGMTPEQAQQTVNTWETEFAEIRAQAEETARRVGQTIADTVTALTGVVFMMMIVSLAGAVFGGYAGVAPVVENAVVTRRTTTTPRNDTPRQ